MPVITITHLDKLQKIYFEKYAHLKSLLYSRELNSANEGCRKGHWIHPENMCGTIGSSMDIRIAIEDFKSILKEIQSITK